MPLDTGFDAPAKLPTEWPDNGPGQLRRQVLPGQRQPVLDGRLPHHVERVRPLGEHVLRAPGGAGRPGRRGGRGEEARHQLRAPRPTPSMARDGAGGGARSPSASIDTTPLELASAYATVAAEGTYCAAAAGRTRSPTPNGRPVAVAPNCKQVLEPDVARAATDAARCPVGQQSTFGKCDGGTAHAGRRRSSAAARWPARPAAPRTTHRDVRRVHPARTAAAGIANDPDEPVRPRRQRGRGRVVTAVAQTLRTAVGDGDYPDFTPPSQEIAFGGINKVRKRGSRRI